MKRNIERHAIQSRFLGEERSIYVSLPPGYNELISYPVLYCQDGVDYLTMGRIVTQANEMIANAELNPFIIVGINVDRSHRTAEYHPHGSRHEAYIRFFAEELLPFIETHYPAIPNPEDRILTGDSLGGTVSLSIALNYSTLFRKILSLSGAFGPETIEELASRKGINELHMYMLIGLSETSIETGRGTFDFLEWNRKVKEFLKNQGASVHYIEKDGVHTWGFWQKELPEALKYFFSPSYLL